MMSMTDIFFCNCGNTIQRPKDRAFENVDGSEREPVYGIMAWHAKLGDGILRGIRCSKCKQNWMFTPRLSGEFVEVEPCCTKHRCACTYEGE